MATSPWHGSPQRRQNGGVIQRTFEAHSSHTNPAAGPARRCPHTWQTSGYKKLSAVPAQNRNMANPRRTMPPPCPRPSRVASTKRAQNPARPLHRRERPRRPGPPVGGATLDAGRPLFGKAERGARGRAVEEPGWRRVMESVKLEDQRRLTAPPGVCSGNLKKMAGAAGLEPVTSAVTGQRSKPIELRPRESFRRANNTGKRPKGQRIFGKFADYFQRPGVRGETGALNSLNYLSC